MSTSPTVNFPIHGKVDDTVENVINLLGKGLKDAHDAIKSLKAQHDALATQVTGVSATATAASKQATSNASQLSQPVPAGQSNVQTADYSLQQQDHLGMVTLQGTSALNVTLNNLVTAPFVSHLINTSTQPATLASNNAASLIFSATNPSGAASYTLAAGDAVHAYYDGLNWTVA